MELKDQLLARHSRQQSGVIMDQAIKNPSIIGELVEYMNSENILLAQRAAWPLGLLVNTHSSLLAPYINELVECLEKPIHPAVGRNVYRILQYVTIPDNLQGILFELCARDLANHKNPVAIKVFCMTVAHKICKHHPDLSAELRLLIESGLESATAGYLSRARKILKHL